MIRRAIILVSLTAIAAVIACREDIPGRDPTTPANSPIPKVDKKDDEPKQAPGPQTPDPGKSSSFGDAG